MNSTITNLFEGKLSSKAYLFSIKHLNLDTHQEISLGTIIVNTQSAQTSIRLIPKKDNYIDKDFDLKVIAKDCLDYARNLEEVCILF